MGSPSDITPISSVYYTNVENIPLTLCCVSGTAIVINFVQCIHECGFCPWDANLSMRSARIVEVSTSTILSAIEKYKPDIVFLSGGMPWEYSISAEILKALQGLNVLKGVKVLTNFNTLQSYERALEVIDLCDVVLVEVFKHTMFDALFNIVSRSFGKKHVEIAVVDEADTIYSTLTTVIKNLVERGMRIPVSIISNSPDEAHLYRQVDALRKSYPLVVLPYAKLSEYSSILCPNCSMPIVVRSGNAVLKISIDSRCKCVYCGYKVISAEKDVCRSKRMVKVPITIPIA